MSRGPDAPWGHKLTVHVYVEGPMGRAIDVSDQLCKALDLPEIEFAGITVTTVDEKLEDQVAT